MDRQPSFFAGAPRTRSTSPLRVALALGLLTLGAFGSLASCGSETTGPSTPKEQCVGGYINPDTKECEGKCMEEGDDGVFLPIHCVQDNTCVGNRCVLKCDSHLDCFHDGSQNCAPAAEDETNASITACITNGKPKGVGVACPFNTECAPYGVCASGGGCDFTLCGGQPDTCVKDEDACKNDPKCTVGKCAGDGTACTVNACPMAECSPLICRTSGIGDANAFCTLPGCASDDDCAGGFYCGYTRDPHSLCPDAPVPSECGKTTEDCIDSAKLSESLKEGSVCLQRKTCLKRTQCTPCTTDLDCSLVDSQKCVDVGGETRCVKSCSVNKDCDRDSLCNNGFCTPRFGKCVGDGGFCEPCLNDEDCGGKGTNKICFEYNGQRACVDKTLGTCASNADCPKSPGNNLSGTCVGNAGAGYCLPPQSGNEFQCW